MNTFSPTIDWYSRYHRNRERIRQWLLIAESASTWCSLGIRVQRWIRSNRILITNNKLFYCAWKYWAGLFKICLFNSHLQNCLFADRYDDYCDNCDSQKIAEYFFDLFISRTMWHGPCRCSIKIDAISSFTGSGESCERLESLNLVWLMKKFKN